jgi:uncharacterized protein
MSKKQTVRMVANKEPDNVYEAMAQEMVLNAMLSRQEWIKRHSDPRRDVDAECRYPISIKAEDYSAMWRRFGIAKRVVNIESMESWQVKPEIYDSEESDETEFEITFKKVNERHKLLAKMLKADCMSGIGRYGIMLLGINDGKKLSQPVAGVPKSGVFEEGMVVKAPSNGKARKLLFVRVFDESMAKVSKWDNDPQSPRFGQPEMYTITLLSPDDLSSGDTDTAQPGTGEDAKVHWTRIVHFARNTTSSEVLGTPEMEDVFNHLLDLKKVLGAAAEGYWQAGFPGLSFETQKDLENVELDVPTMKKQAKKYMEGLQRFLLTQGMNVKTLAPNVQDPLSQFETAIKAICTTKGIPYRIFMGTEEAKLAGDEDKDSWKGRMTARRMDFVEPEIIRAVVDRLIMFGIIPVPQNEEYTIYWPDMHEASEKEVAEISKTITAALKEYVAGGVNELMTPEDFLTHVMKFEPDGVQTIIDNALAQIEEQEAGGIVPLGRPSEEEIREDERFTQKVEQASKMNGKNGKPANGKPVKNKKGKKHAKS